MFFLDILKRESPLSLRWLLITRLIDEVPTIKVTYESRESIPAPSKINDCQINEIEDCMKYVKNQLSVSENVRNHFDQFFSMDPTNCTGLLHNGSISLKEGDWISFFQSDSKQTSTLMKFKPKTTILQVEKEQKFVAFGGSPEKPLTKRFKDPLEKSQIERIEYLESQIERIEYLESQIKDVKSEYVKSEDIKLKDFNTYFYF
ncbi:19117_t:CDS:2 [Gigaspora margarita]|uniref:19117_t:CDS:1 n=1 Tax=Gigaspora margarita TaxID=4874 RepID=A0ABM8W4T0_GIGMA|nr:19117_t:CDS:2 [Gigaspora margarita]